MPEMTPKEALDHIEEPLTHIQVVPGGCPECLEALSVLRTDVEQPTVEEILLHQFPPFSEPAAYSHEQESGWDVWQDDCDCDVCPHFVSNPDEWGDDWPECELEAYGVPDKCRFPAYRRVLFRRFEL